MSCDSDNEVSGNLSSAPHRNTMGSDDDLTLISPPNTYKTPPGGRAHRWLSALRIPLDESNLFDILTRRTIFVVLCFGVNKLIDSLSSIERIIALMQCKRVVGRSLTSLAQVLLLRGFLLFFVNKKVLLCNTIHDQSKAFL